MTSTVIARRSAVGGALLLAGCLLLTACAGGSSSSSPRSAPPAAGRRPLAEPGAPVNGAASSAAGSSAARSSAGLIAGLVPADQSIVYTATITVRAANVPATARRVTGLVQAAGGYVSHENAGTASPGRRGETIDITLKIPVPSYQAVLARLSSPALGQQLAMNQQATDETQQVANVSSEVTSEEDAIAALDGLLSRAASVSDLLQVQQQISADESTLNSLLAQQRALNGETSYATVTMTLVGPLRVHPRRGPAPHSFNSGLLAGWRALRHAVGWLATALGAALPFAVLVIVLAGLGYAGWRRYLRRRGQPSEAG